MKNTEDSIAEDLIYALYKYYKVDNNIQLAEKLNTTQQTISNWKSRNSINAIKKKCRELGIYKAIFENDEQSTSSKISKENIHSKLFLFKRSSLAYLYYLLQKKDIKNGIDYFNWQIVKDEENKFISFISDFHLDLTNENISFSTFRVQADQYISLLLKIDELDYILENNEMFSKTIIFIMNEKR